MKIISVLYGRVSTLKEQQDSSITNQMILDDDRFDIIYKGFERRSGYKSFLKRTELIHILYEYFGIETVSDAEVIYFKKSSFKVPKAKTLIVSNLSRLARNTKISLQIIEALKSVACNIYIQDLGKFNIGNDLLISILASIEEGFSASLAEKVKLGFNKTSTLLVGKPTGYKNYKDRLIQDEKAGDVRKMFDLALAGEGSRVISKETGYGQSTVLNILKNSLYSGIYKDAFNDKIEAIIAPEEFQQVQNLLKARNNNPSNTRIKDLSRKLECKCCGQYYIRNLKTRYKDKVPYKHLFLECNTVRKLKDKFCPSVRLEYDVLNEFIANSILDHKELLDFSFSNIEFSIDNLDLDKQLEEKNKEIMDLIVNANKYGMEVEYFKQVQQQLLSEKDVIEERIENLQSNIQQENILRSLEKTYLGKLREIQSDIDSKDWKSVYNKILHIDVDIIPANRDNTKFKPHLSNLRLIEFKPIYDYLEEHKKPFNVIHFK